MRQRIMRLAEGSVKIDTPIPELSRQIVEESIAYGQNYRGEFRFTSGNQLAFRGLIYSDNSRILLHQNTYAGTNIYISYEVITDGLEDGTVLEGAFSLVYNGGEYQLPYCFRIVNSGKTHRVALETLADFADFARNSPREAAEMFESREFPRLPFMQDLAIRGLYEGLRRAADHGNLVEEFLCGTGTKERVTLTLAETSRKIRVDVREKMESVVIRRNTWGTLRADVTCDNTAVVFAHTSFTDQDFREDEYVLRFSVDPNELHNGHNYARIRIEAPLQTITMELDIFRQAQNARIGRKLHERRQGDLEFRRCLLRYLAKETGVREDLEELQRCWNNMVQEQEATVHQHLYHAVIAYWRSDLELASSILEEAKPMAEGNRRNDLDTYCAYLHLQCLVMEDWERREEMRKILNFYEKEEELSEGLFLLKLYLEDPREDRSTETLDRLRTYFNNGSFDPFLFLMACRIYNRHPDILKRLDRFELITLWFGARMEMLTEETAVHVASMASMEHSYRPFLSRILKRLYQTYEKDEILAGLCQMIVRGDRRKKEDHIWFARGVERDIRLTRLYDYYLYTVPEDKEEAFPREIWLYFSYNSPRDPASQRVLYRNLCRYGEEDADIMASYRDQMRDYAFRQVRAGRADRDTAGILSRILTRNDVDEQNARLLPDILNSREIRCEYKEFTQVIAVYGEVEDEISVPMENGVAQLPMYTRRCRVIFVDRFGTRYAGIPCETEILFENMEPVLERCRELCPRHAMMSMQRCSRILSGSEPDLEQIRILKREMEARGIRREYRRELMSMITDYIISREEPNDEDVIACVQFSGLSPRQRNRLVQILIEQGQLTEAAAQLRRVGFRQIPLPSLLRLVSLTIQSTRLAMDESLLDMSYYLFTQGQWDDVILEYLTTHFNSSCERMLPLLMEADQQEMPLHGMAERLLSQMLFTDTASGLDEVFELYRKNGGSDPLLLQAYYSVKCREYFLQGHPVDESVFAYVRQSLEAVKVRRAVPQICLLALCRYYASRTDLTPEEKELCREQVFRLYRQGLIFAWMKDLQGQVVLPQIITQREWLEYHGEPDQNLTLRAVIQPESEDNDPIHVVLPQVYTGIYTCPVLLFDGESLSYEILRESDRTVLDRGVLKGRASAADDYSSFGEMNRLQKLSGRKKDAARLQRAMQSYAEKEGWTEELFTTD